MKNWVIVALVAVIAIGGTIAAFAAVHETTANVEVRVWQRVSDGELYLSTRPEGGTWTTHDAEPLDMSELSRSRNFRQSSFVTVEVPVVVELPDPEPVEESTLTPTPTPMPTPTPTPTPTPEVSQALPGRGGSDGDDWQHHETLSSWSNNILGDIRLWVGCIELNLGTTTLPLVSMHYDGYHFGNSRLVSYTIDGGPVETETWSAGYVSGGTSRVTPSAAFLAKLRNADTMEIQILITTVTLNVTGAGAVMDDLGCFE